MAVQPIKKLEDLRSAVRFPLKLKVSVKGQQMVCDAETENISSGGVLFDVDNDLPVGSDIEFSIAMPGEALGSKEDVLVNCQGRVMRCDPKQGRRTVAAVIDEYHFERA